MNQVYDINKLPTDGYLVFPLSMGKLHSSQSPEKCYQALEYFFDKISKFGIDVVFLYTNDLYLNKNISALEVRKKTLQQMLNHSGNLKNLIIRKKKFIPQAFHFLPWDYVILNSIYFKPFMIKLNQFLKKDSCFLEEIKKDIGERKVSEANINFILEEVAVTHIVRQKLVEFPKTLVKEDTWRLIVYPGEYLKSDFYQFKKKVLLQNKERLYYKNAHYDLNEKKLYDFSILD